MKGLWVLIAMAAIMALVAAPVASAAEGGADRPFRASFDGEVHWEFPGDFISDCAEVTTVSDADGQATHMGRVHLASSHCPGEPAYELDGHATFVAANGDELYGVYDYDPVAEGNQIMFAFEGGTGRFAGATGEAIWTYYLTPVLVDGCDDPENFDCLDFLVPWHWWSTLIGTISY